jgi:hypothetical protein
MAFPALIHSRAALGWKNDQTSRLFAKETDQAKVKHG